MATPAASRANGFDFVGVVALKGGFFNGTRDLSHKIHREDVEASNASNDLVSRQFRHIRLLGTNSRKFQQTIHYNKKISAYPPNCTITIQSHKKSPKSMDSEPFSNPTS
jgi:hypothetical protein